MPQNQLLIPIKLPEHINFRLKEPAMSVLAERAADKGLSPNQLARDYVMEALQEQEQRAELRKAVDACRRDLAAATAAILQASGNVSEANIEAWVRENLNRPC